MCLGPFDQWMRVPKDKPIRAFRVFLGASTLGAAPLTSLFRFSGRRFRFVRGVGHRVQRFNEADMRRGFHCLRTPKAAMRAYEYRFKGQKVYGEVLIWGLVARHRSASMKSGLAQRAGYRAQYMTIVRTWK